MANNDTMSAPDRGSRSPYEAIGRLDERVTNLHNRFTGLEQEVQTSFRHLEAAVENVAREVGRSGMPNWIAIFTGIGSVFTLMTILGWLTISPIETNLKRIETSYAATQAEVITRREYEQRWAEYIRLHEILDKAIGERTTLRESDIRDKRTEDAIGLLRFQINRVFERLDQIPTWRALDSAKATAPKTP